MSQIGRETISRALANIVSRFCGKSGFSPEARIYADLGINGSDFIELIEEIETRFGVELNDVSPKRQGEEARDISTEELAALIYAKLLGPSRLPLSE